MITEVVTASPEMPLAEAARLMTEKRIGCLPVVDSSRLIGILTETDFVATFAK
jgi:CBS domain-containing protein